MTVFVSAPSEKRSDAHLTEGLAHWALQWPGQPPPTRGLCGAPIGRRGTASEATHQICVVCDGLRSGMR